ncbi:MAG: hypothetical protein IJ375_01070 [Oscillospiraceae bacterium]|nr:hypothetical protein [Oscillospiraceae bacterium]
MEKFKKALRWFSPPGWVTLLLTAASAAGLVWVFRRGMEEHPVAYAVYMVAFYTLCAVCVKVPAAVRGGKGLVLSNPHAHRYFTDRPFKAKVKLYSSTALNMAYGIFKLVIGIVYHSVWFVSVAVYYMLLSLLRLLLVSADRRSGTLSPEEDLPRQWRSYRACGWLMLLLNGAITGMVIQMVWQNRGYSYPGYVIYVSAAYTFYRLTMAIVRAVKSRRETSPVYAAAGVMDLCAALMSIFALQTAMFSSFGAEMTAEGRFLMNILTGGGVSALVVCAAVWMIVRSNKALKACKL